MFIEKEWFDHQLKDIKVPKEEIENAIEEGIKLGKDKKNKQKESQIKDNWPAFIKCSCCNSCFWSIFFTRHTGSG